MILILCQQMLILMLSLLDLQKCPQIPEGQVHTILFTECLFLLLGNGQLTRLINLKFLFSFFELFTLFLTGNQTCFLLCIARIQKLQIFKALSRLFLRAQAKRYKRC